jgi:Ni,Fe-hydrogenase I large subunit
VIKHVDPISRIEGHLGVRLTVDETTNRVTAADAHGNLWRGFENFLLGRNPNDAITFTQRICGVCPVPHGQASTFAVESVYGYNNGFQTFVAGGQYSPKGLSAGYIAANPTEDDRTALPAGVAGVPAKAVHIRNLVLSAEFLMSSITHFYHLAAPSYVQGPNMPPWTPYYDDSSYHPYLLSADHGTEDGSGRGVLPGELNGFSKDLWSAVIKQYVKALRIRRLTFEAGALFAGRMPMTSCFIAGGVTDDHTADLSGKCSMFYNMMKEVGLFIVKEYVPVVLALGALYPNYDNYTNANTLFSVHPTLWNAGNEAADWSATPTQGATGNTGWGAGVGNFLSWGAFPQADGTLGYLRGYKMGAASTVTFSAADVPTLLTEDITHSRYGAGAAGEGYSAGNIEYPGNVSRTYPKRDDEDKYSSIKAPRINGQPMEVGPLARLMVAGIIQTGQTYASTVPGFGGYTHTVGGVNGLKPSMIEADLAVALVRSGLAQLEDGTNTYDQTNFDTTFTSEGAIAAAYTDAVVITGAIYDWVINLTGGLSTMDRLRARALESLVTIQMMIGAAPFGSMGGWIKALDDLPVQDPTFIKIAPPVGTVPGFGATEAPRGALMHLVTITGGKIAKYQAVVPTTWNASPKGAGATPAPGPIEKSMEGIKYSAQKTNVNGGAGAPIAGGAGGGVEALRVAQSFDPCIACAVH